MTTDDFDFDDVDLEGETQPEVSSNRTFLLVAGILGAILILALVCLGVYAMVYLPGQRNAQSTAAAEINAQNTEVAMLSQMTLEAQSWTATPTITLTPLPVTATRTPVVAPTDTPEGGVAADVAAGTQDPRTATVAALFTQQAAKELTATPSAIPDTGFADDVGIPGMIALAASLVLIIFLARRLRSAG